MIARLGTLLAGLAWAFLVFLCTGYFTFPGDAVADRVEVEVKTGSRGAYELELGDVSPWWIGLSSPSVKVYGRADKEGVNPLLALATDARASASPLSLLSREPYVSGSVTLGSDGLLDFEIGTATEENGDALKVTTVKLDGDDFPLAELLALAPMEGSGSGTVDIKVDLAAPDGMGKADGEIALIGSGLRLIQPVIAEFPLGRDVEIRELDLEFDAKQGKAKISRGRIQTDIANVDISGTITLAEPMDRSTVDLRIEVELDPSMSAFKSMLKSAEVNGKLVWRCTGRVSALSRGCSAGEARSSRARPTRGGTASRDDVKRPRPAPASALTPEEREKRRAELQEKLKKRREKRRADRAARAGKAPGDNEDSLEDEEDEPNEDDALEDLPDDEEDPIDDEEFLEEEN